VNQETIESTSTEKKIKQISMEELGQSMPMGIQIGDGIPVKSFATREWRMKEERELGALRDQQRGHSIGQFVATILSTMCTHIGPYDFEKLKTVEKLIHISQMFVGDVFYVYTWLRIVSLGHNLKLDIKCPSCSNKFKFNANLNTLDIGTAEKFEDTCWNYKLRKPFVIRNKEVTEFLMGPPRWIALEGLKDIGSMDTGSAKAGMILGSIIAISNWLDVNGKPTQVALAINEIDEMCKADIESITAEMDDNAIGPNMSIEGNCPKCHSNYVMPIDWSFDSFFGSSGR
jgi:hypothetical protein